ncbi:hypothetical protein Ddc_02353 [Ditylenchus destructor]|nr:hypothetical protein Ddc_02353 [Ditylenchus destructor]
MYPAISTVLSMTTFTAALTECFKKKAKKTPLVLEQAKPEQPMDQPPQPNIPFGLFYNILTCFDRRELCQLRNVNRRHYIVIEKKFGTTPPYLVFLEQELNIYSWEWTPSENQGQDMPIQVRKQLPTSKFVRFNSSAYLISNVSELIVLPMSHVWENQELIIECAPKYVWNEEWTHLATKAKYLDLDGKGLIPYLRQLTSGNCLHLVLSAWNDDLVDVELPWGHILDFLFKRNTKGIDIYAKDRCQDQMVGFLQQVKQKFMDSLAPVDFSFEWTCTSSPSSDWPVLLFYDFNIKNRQTKQRLVFHCNPEEFRLTVEPDQ